LAYEGYLFSNNGINSCRKCSFIGSSIMGVNYSDYYGLLFNCPFDKELELCALKNMRLHTTKERFIYYEALTITERKALINQHHKCLLIREKKSLFHESQ
jgi:hypothetical protein